MNYNKNYFVQYRNVLWLSAMLICAGCSGEPDYSTIVEQELATGIRQDSLFLGFYFGMPEMEFYSSCWKQNQEGVIKEGYSNVTVYYPLTDLEHEGFLDFFPIFKNGKIQSIKGYTMYNSWAPWNKDLWSDHLIEDTKELFEKWYGGNNFVQLEKLGLGKAYVKVDGNRRIVLYYTEDSRVNVVLSDLTNLDDELSLG